MTSSPPAPPGTNDQLSPIRSSRPSVRPCGALCGVLLSRNRDYRYLPRFNSKGRIFGQETREQLLYFGILDRAVLAIKSFVNSP